MSANRSNASQQPRFFDLITEGVGYLNRIREVKPSSGPAYLACTINAIVGPENNVGYRSFELRVVGSQAYEAIDIIQAHLDRCDNDRPKTVVVFRAGDASPESYNIQVDDGRGGKRNETRFCLRARLLQIKSAKIDGQPIELPQVEQPGEQGGSDQGDDDHGGNAADDQSYQGDGHADQTTDADVEPARNSRTGSQSQSRQPVTRTQPQRGYQGQSQQRNRRAA